MNNQPTRSQKYTKTRVSKWKQFPSDLAEINRENEAWKPRSSSSWLLSNPFQRARSFILWARLSRRIRASGTEKVFLVKQSTELKRGTMKAGNQKQWAIVDRRSPLSSRFAFSVPSFLLLPSTSYNSLVFIPPWNEQRSNELPYA